MVSYVDYEDGVLDDKFCSEGLGVIENESDFFIGIF